MKNIEVEIRSFISKEKYDELLEYFKKNSRLKKEDFQETHYLKSDQDIRIQKSDFKSKIWLKKGKIHDNAREEIEINFNKDDFSKIEELFKVLKYYTEIKWFRKRFEFDWKGLKVCLDYTKGYGYIIELEKITDEIGKEKDLLELKLRLKELNIPLTSKDEFNKKFEEYKRNWRELIK
jgi:predicted adenylyl cyclase CyaB